MKFHFNERQRFSLRKYSFGLASVLLGTAFFLSGQVASADEVNVSETLLTSVVSVSPESSTSTSESSVPRTSESKPTVADKSTLSLETADSKSTVEDKAVVTPEKAGVSSDSEKPVIESPKSEKSEASAKESSEETAKATEVKAEVAEKDDKFTDKAPAEVAEKDDKSTDKALAKVAEKDDKSTDKASAEARRSTRTRRATSEDKREVSNWSEFVSALEDENVSDITVNGDIVAQGDNGNTDNGRSGSVDRKTTINAPSRPVTIQGKDDNARLDLLSHTLELTGASWELNLKNLKIASANSRGPIELSRTSGSNTVTFENVTSEGSSLYGGGGNTNVVIKGNTTSTVSDSYQAANGQTQYVQRNVGQAGKSDKRRESNIHDAKSVTVAEGASLTLNRSSQGDAITLESGAKVSVKDKASLTINMNTAKQTDSARYHNAGIFMADSGTVETGKGSKLVLNTSIGQGISIGINRPGDNVTDKDRFGGYGAGNNGRKNGPSRVLIGEEGTFEFNGRDGIMMGNHSELVTGQNSKVRFENKGRGVALDFGNDSRVVFGKHSTNTFHSVGKGKNGGAPSGSYDGYNYIGLNENGKILVDDYATFRVQMDNRGDNDWDDVISLGSQNGTKSEPLFQANKGSIVDIRDDNTNYYAELISVALGNSSNTFFQFNNPFYVAFMRYTKSDSLSAGEITGKLPLSIPQGNNPQDIGHGNILYISNKSEASGNRVEFNGPTNNAGVGTYTVYSMNKDGRDAQSHNKQSSVWMNIQGGSMSIAGFQNNRAHIEPANATSVPTGSSTGGVVATDRTYGIDPVGDNRQNIWVSNGSKINPTGVHKNVIKYVYEDGTPVKEDVIQSSDWKRTLDVSIDQEGFKKILKNSSVSNGDEFLAAYSKAKYHISDIDGDNIADTGWKVDGTNSGTYNYGTIASPKVDGYKAEILSTNVPGLEAGAKADSVSVSYDSSNATDTLIEAQAGKRTVSETYWRNIVAKSDLGTYETVVVYKKVKQKATVKYIDTSANNKELAKDTVEGAAGETIAYSTAAKIADFVNKGYKLVEDGFTNSTEDQKKFDDDENIDQEFVVKLAHDVTPVGPNNPHKPTEPINPNDPNSPRYPAENQWKKDVTSTVHYVVSDGKATAPADNVQNAQWTRTLNVDKVTGEVLNPTEPWAANKANYDAVPTPGLTGYYADKASVASKTVTQENLEETVTYRPLGKLVPKPETPKDPNFPSTPEVPYPNDPNDPTKPGQPVVPNVPGYKPYLPDPNYPTKPGEPGRPVEPGKPITPENPGTDTEIIYRKVDQKAIIKYVDQNTGATLESDQVGGKSGEAIAYSTADKIKKYQDRGYVLVSDGFPAGATYDKDESVDQEFVVTLKHGETPVGPNDPHNPTDPINPNDPKSPKYPAEDQWKKDVTSTVHYVVSDGNATAPADKVQNAQWTRTLKLDKVTGEVLSSTPWASNKANYDAVPTPGLTGYYADKGSVASKTVTQENLEETVTYKPLGKLVPKPETPKDPNFPSTPEVKYPNDPNDPTKPGKPVVPNVPGYKPYLPDPNDPSKPGQPVEPGKPITPENPGKDTPIIYVPKTNDVTQPTKQTVKYTSTDGKAQVPSDKIQNDYTFTGKKNQADGTTTWTENSHTYGRESVPVVSGYYADKSEAGSKTVTPTNPNAEDVVTYKPLGKIIQVDESGNVIPGSVSKTYENNPLNPKEAAETKIPDAPTGYVIKEEQPQAWGYNIVDKTIEPNDESDPDRISQDTKIVYVKADQKAVIKYVDQTTGQTLANDQVGGKSGEAINYSTADKIKYYEDRGYVLVSDEFPAGVHFDTDASVDQTWTVTLKHGETPVGPNDPHNPTDPINPNDPNSPKYPATDQWKKDVTSTVKYVVSDGKVAAPADHVENATWTRTLTLDKVTGKELSATPWASDKTAYAAVPTPGLTGYYADKASVASKAVTQENLEETVTYKPLGNLVPKPEKPNDPNFPSTPGVKYPNDPTDPTKPGQPVVPDVPGYEPHLPDPNDPTKPGQPIQPGTPVTPDKPGEDTPIIYVPKTNDVTQPTKQTVTFEGAGTATPADKVQDNFTFTGKQKNGTTTWDQPNHTYGKETVPVVKGYYADKKEAGSKTVTPDQPEVTDKVTYKPLGKIIPVDPEGNPIPKAPTPQYNNDPQDPTKGGETPTPVIPGYVTDTPSVTPNDPGSDTPVVYRKAEQKAIIKYVDQTTGQTLANDQVGGKSGEAINYSTADKIKYYEDRGYVLVSDEFPAGVHFDTDASVDQTWTVTLKHGETPVGPNDPHNPTDPINPNDPNSPKYPATDQWKKDVMSTVHYVGAGSQTPADNVQNAQWTRTLKLDKVTGKVLNPDEAWTTNKTNYDAVPTPSVTGYYADKASVASKTVTQENLEETVTYKPLGNLVPKPETPNDPNFPSTPEVKYPNDPTDPTKPGQPVVP
ncbi:pectate lyase-like adhesive domain-containing protein, partial [Streptococcus sp. 27098_8_69]|uniref:mucin-binding protein n=1 Tax=Streptococcus sp. 27098_8_69 TaxID=3003664 RepID=UPI00352BFBCC